MIRAFVRFYFRRNVANWRALRREAMALIPKAERKENGDSL